MIKWTKARSGIYIIPNRWGLGMMAIIGILFYLSVSINQNLLFFFTFWFASLFVVLLIMGHFNLANLEIYNAKVTDLYAGQSAHLELHFSSSKLNRHRELHFEWGQSFFTQSLDLQINTSPLNRGKYSASRLMVWSDYPMGLFFVWRSYPISGDFYVYPKRLMSSERQESPLVAQGRSDFKDHKNYEIGGPLSGVNWKFFSRSGHLLIKEFEEHDHERVVLSYHDCFGNHEERLEQLSGKVSLVHQQGRVYQLVLPNQKQDFGKGHDHFLQSMRFLSEA